MTRSGSGLSGTRDCVVPLRPSSRDDPAERQYITNAVSATTPLETQVSHNERLSPRLGSSTNPEPITPRTAPSVLIAYSTPTDRPIVPADREADDTQKIKRLVHVLVDRLIQRNRRFDQVWKDEEIEADRKLQQGEDTQQIPLPVGHAPSEKAAEGPPPPMKAVNTVVTANVVLPMTSRRSRIARIS